MDVVLDKQPTKYLYLVAVIVSEFPEEIREIVGIDRIKVSEDAEEITVYFL